MYSTCLFCNGDLGRNEVIEPFPVGRRLAYDAAKGRLWVVCKRCGRWNLSPLEERWEAIEQCERRYHDTRLRVSTDNVGLARLREGLELVRIGQPRRPEFAAWRYGDQFGRRRRGTLLKVGAGVVVVGAVVVGGVATGVISGFGYWTYQITRGLVRTGYENRVIARIPDSAGTPVIVRQKHADAMRLLPDVAGVGDTRGGWRLSVQSDQGPRVFDGDPAVRAAGLVLAGVNRFGATPRQVHEAVGLIESVGAPERYLTFAAKVAAQQGVSALPRMPYEVRLALEMASHEDAERRAMEGELTELERAWREAEEIAAIADDLLLPSNVGEFIERNRRQRA